jgi:hypothetical protein
LLQIPGRICYLTIKKVWMLYRCYVFIASKAGIENREQVKGVVMRNDVHMRINLRCFSMTAYECFFMALVGKWPR